VLGVTRLLFKDGIQLNGLPAPPAEITDAYLPFHPAGQTFHRTQPRPQRLSTLHRHFADGRFVSVPEPGLSPRVLAGAAVQRGGRSFLRCQGTRSRPPAHQPNILLEVVGNKNFGKKRVGELLLLFSLSGFKVFSDFYQIFHGVHRQPISLVF